MPDDTEASDLTTDAAFGGRLTLTQPRRGHRFGHDAILLAAATPARAAQRVVEFGAGVGAAGLALIVRVPAIHLTLIDIEPHLVKLAGVNARLNNIGQWVTTVALDVTATAREFSTAGLDAESIDHVMMNPPFNDPAQQRCSPKPERARAHSGGLDLLRAWCKSASRLLKPNGMVTLIWRADGLGDVLPALAGFGSIMIMPVHPRADSPAIRILVRATKGSRGPLRLLPGFVLNEADGRPSAAADAILRDAAALPLA
jgi:tRNA1(Val) A37 N6-methylase TrmN6